MARGLNRVQLIGNLGDDPQVRYTGEGVVIANLSVATGDRKKTADGWAEVTEWHRVAAFGKTAEICKDFLRKGSRVFIEGRLQTRSWEKDGEKRYMTEVVCQSLLMLDGPRGDSTPSASPPPETKKPPVRRYYDPPAAPDQDLGGESSPFDDLPF